ncbi:hypothetical protein Celal_0144 [Cellulophaga algicola DSM 14237]|uniref:Uncharacterized protein n=1 Tax=Cellulophaga algicola (strain DSM 14237 / IC166 / ACAM 630) TaxID=688270 RepID=E6X748_CELAD|nr:hypothetical protein [Cellulophaga algicola]ADV47497.1 hypothetical protein Celal_0144 [Cellulophaga algicola DSM 14237]
MNGKLLIGNEQLIGDCKIFKTEYLGALSSGGIGLITNDWSDNNIIYEFQPDGDLIVYEDFPGGNSSVGTNHSAGKYSYELVYDFLYENSESKVLIL